MKKIYNLNFLKNKNLSVSDIKLDYAGIYISKHLYNQKESFNLNLQKPTSKQIKNKNFYRYSNLTLPRIKVDILKDEHKIKVTRNKDQADYRIISEAYLDSLISTNYHNAVTVSTLIQELKNINFKQDIIDFFNNLNQEDIIAFDRYFSPNGSKDYVDIINIFSNKSLNRYNFISKVNETYYLELSQKNNLVEDCHIVSLCNENSVIITLKEYRTMQKMIKSGDKENVTLALEMMANCNLEASFDYISLIYYFLQDTLRDANNWNNVNVKSLRKRLSKFNSVWNYESGNYYNNYLVKLVEEDKLTEFAFKETARYVFHNVIKKTMGFTEEHDHILSIELDSIKLNEKYKDKLKSTILNNSELLF